MSHRFLHISDPHVGKTHGYESLNAAALLAAAEERILLVTGDVTDGGSEEQMALARKALRPAQQVGAWVVPGNHDVYGWNGISWPSATKRARFCRIFSANLGDPIQSRTRFPYTVSIAPDLVLVGIDTNHHAGVLAAGAIDAAQHKALRRFFRRRWPADTRFIVLLHHHPVEYGAEGPIPALDWLLPKFIGPQLAMSEECRRKLFEHIGAHKVLMLHGHKHLPFNTYKTKTAGNRVRVVGGAAVNPSVDGVGGRLARVDISAKRFIVRHAEVPAEFLRSSTHHGGIFPVRSLPQQAPKTGADWAALLGAQLPKDWRHAHNSRGQPVWSEPSGLHLVRLRVYKQHIVARIRCKSAVHERSSLQDALRSSGRTEGCNAKGWFLLEWRVAELASLTTLLDDLEREWSFRPSSKR